MNERQHTINIRHRAECAVVKRKRCLIVSPHLAQLFSTCVSNVENVSTEQ
jgi:hypothetical protein